MREEKKLGWRKGEGGRHKVKAREMDGKNRVGRREGEGEKSQG